MFFICICNQFHGSFDNELQCIPIPSKQTSPFKSIISFGIHAQENKKTSLTLSIGMDRLEKKNNFIFFQP